MLIAISGSQGCGKTTTINELKKLGCYKTIDRKVSRSVQQEWGMTLAEINKDIDLTLKFQEEVLNRKVADERAAIESPDVWITERSYADYFTYSLIVLGKEPSLSDWIDQYFIRCMRLQQTYFKVFYLTAGHFAVETDPNRAASNQHYVRMADATMLDVTKTMTAGEVLEVIDVPGLELRTSIISAMIKRADRMNWRT